MKMPPITTRSTTAAISRILFLEKVIDITAEQTVVDELCPGLLLQPVSHHQGRRQGDWDLYPPVHIALHRGQHRGVVGQRLHLFLLLGGQDRKSTRLNSSHLVSS